MSFTSFLLRAGQILSEITGVAAIEEPIINACLPNAAQSKAANIEATVNSELVGIGGEIANVESISAALGTPGLSTEQKIQAAASGVGQVIAASPLLGGKVIANQASYDNSVTLITQGFQQLLDSLKLK